ncbi:Bacteriophage replication gene A protein (GPA) [Kosakonia radicincitans]|uniref:replication endonuclease n=1 Tax=Kosakonia radicincitans TaxID=283686 RepID=UPI0009A59433|nr:replication endonuclease [Kosakonia radicincitans]SKC23390.1 Bacteriophage replication gene A protein (GPA) [Kosakonia radicincitans]
MTTANRGRRAPSPPPPFPGSSDDATRYAYEWNKPRKAIYVDKTPAVDLVELGQEQEFLDWVKRTLQPLPLFIRRRLAVRIDSIHSMKGRHIARLAVRDIVRRDLPHIQAVTEQYSIPVDSDGEAYSELNTLYHTFKNLGELTRRFNNLPDYVAEDVELMAQDIAIYMTGVLSEVNDDIAALDDRQSAVWLYNEAARLTLYFRQMPPGSGKRKLRLDELATAISKMLDSRWWHRALRKYAVRWREHLHIAFGDVKRDISPYCSKHHVSEWDTRRKRSRAIMSKLELEDQDTKERISLIEQIDKSISNPEKRRIELMTRIGGFEKIANENGFAGSFFTLTTPSRYHAWSMFGHRNAKWSGASPRAAQRYLNRIWQHIRAELARREIPVFGLRVAESHHDGTPHWHGLLFTAPEHVSELREVMQDYATREDAEELRGRNGKLPRFEMKDIDPEKGSATGYVVKYISKNIDGYALDGEADDESGRPLKETAKHATAWASCWGIRQFQFLGGAPVSVWRELRRMHDQALADSINPLFGELHRAADSGDWQQYVQLQGGAFVARKNLVVRIWYQIKDEPNTYGEYQNLIKGLVMPAVNIEPVITRLKTYCIVKMKPPVSDGAGLAVDLQGAPAPSWTRVNNCTEAKKQTTPPPSAPSEIAVSAGADGPEQIVIGQLTREQKKRIAESIRNYKPERKKSPAEEFEVLAHAITSGEHTEYDQARAESYLRAARELRKQEQALTPEVETLAGQVQVWAQIKKIQISRIQAIQLARGEEVTALDTVYRANPRTGELVITDVDKQWRKTLATHRKKIFVDRWKTAIKMCK